MNVTLNLVGMPTKPDYSRVVRFVGFVRGAALISNSTGKSEHYSLKNGKRLRTNWDFWRLSDDDIVRLRKMRDEQKADGER